MNIYRYKDFLAESKQAGILYHFTSPKGLRGILEDNEMSSAHGWVSFTRNYNLKQWWEVYGSVVRIAFDGDRISNKFKIEPNLFDPAKDPIFAPTFPPSYKERLDQYKKEAEERVKGILKPVITYILKIDVLEPLPGDKNKDIIDELMLDYPDLDISYVDNFEPVKLQSLIPNKVV